MALDGVTWPAINPKTLRVAFSSKVCSSNFSYPSGFCLLLVKFSFFANHIFSPSFTQEEMKKLAEGGDDAGVAGRVGVELEGRSLLRDWDRNKVNMTLLICSETGTAIKR